MQFVPSTSDICGVETEHSALAIGTIPHCNPILFAICTSTFSKLCKQRIKYHVEGRSVELLCK
jgi:hypothetical protein